MTRSSRRRLLGVVFLVLPLAAAHLAHATETRTATSPSPTASDGPAVSVENPKVNLGDQLCNKKLSHTFHVKNAGTAPLVLSKIRTSCGCTTGALPPKPIAPGETGDVEVGFVPREDKERLGAQNFVATFETNDPRTPTVDLTVSARLTRVVEAVPASIELASDSSQAQEERFIEVRCYRDKTLPKITGFASSPATIGLTFVSESQTERGTSSCYSVRLPGNAQTRQGVLTFTTDDSTLPLIEVPVKLSTATAIAATPAQILLGLVEAGDTKSMTTTLAWKSAAQAPVSVKSDDARLTCQLDKGPASAALRVTLTAQTDVAQPQKIKTNIHVLDDNKVVLLDLPVLAVVVAAKAKK